MTFIITADVSCKLNMYKEQRKCYTRKHKDQFTIFEELRKIELFMPAEVRTCAPTR